uniref:Uncharacterized protein n=1 Tax=Ackermannviridae sp. ctaCq7 TaxID=2827294 RepID=A0A8S5R5A0_9CAUD|nr:MAG TPA: hypothetical protein [Ackermannviridae sp. ctaCq7]
MNNNWYQNYPLYSVQIKRIDNVLIVYSIYNL